MDQATINQLSALNETFYETVAEPFHRSRNLPWSGWQTVLKTIDSQFDQTQPLDVLDLGCGNGRWGTFLLKNHPHNSLRYVGVDSNANLLQYACRELLPSAEVLSLFNQDLDSYLNEKAGSKDVKKFDLIVLFGVWHHVPGSAHRAAILLQLAKLLKPKGLLVISCWRFLRSPQLAGRTIEPERAGFDEKTLEAGDFFLDWQSEVSAIRYCHDTDRSEIVAQSRAAGLHTIREFSADGKSSELNDYYIFSLQQLLAEQR